MTKHTFEIEIPKENIDLIPRSFTIIVDGGLVFNKIYYLYWSEKYISRVKITEDYKMQFLWDD